MLIMVLVLSVILALVILPTLGYATAVMRANRLVGDKGRQTEAVRAGARISMADPFELFARCKPGSTFELDTNVNLPAHTSCRELVDRQVGVIDASQIPYGTVALQLGEDTPNNAVDGYSPADGSTTDWWNADAAAAPTTGTIWTPLLPPRPNVLSNPAGYTVGAPYNCTVYFPGRFDQPVVLDGPTYFASGVYYFEDTLTVVGGADVVVGMGVFEGCIDDYDVVRVVEPREPLPSGGGGTFVFGGDARLVVDDTLTTDASGNLVANSSAKPLQLRFNQRYVPSSWMSDGRVSIFSVNGDIDANPGPPVTAGDLVVPDVIDVPLSPVATSTSTVTAIEQGYVPSTLTAEPRAPEAPAGVMVSEYRDPAAPAGQKGVVAVRWDAPDAHTEGGSLITEYTVTASNGATCTTDGSLGCLVTGLSSGTTYTFRVTARNALGVSPASAPVSATPTTGSPQIGPPGSPLAVALQEYDDAVGVSWDPPASDGGTPVTDYEVTAYRVYTVPLTGLEVEEAVGGCTTAASRGLDPELECVVDPLTDLPLQDVLLNDNVGYRFEVTATNRIGTSAPAVSATTDRSLDGGTPDPAEPPPAPVAATYVPDPIVDIDTSGPAVSVVEFAGYVAVPQGRVDVERTSDTVRLRGGVLAGSYGLADDVATQPKTFVGFENTVLQRTVQLVTTASGMTSTMTVQINESGAYAVNSWVIQ